MTLAAERELSARTILEQAFADFGKIALAFSGAEDVAIIDMAAQLRPEFDVFCLDTGRLHPETYRFIEHVRKHYRISIEMLAPDAERLEPFVRAKGLFSFYEDGHKECCGIRKVAPLSRKLATLDAWITGLRQSQNPSTRAEVSPRAPDPAFSGNGATLFKVNPLHDWSLEDVWSYLRENQVPYNPLHERGFVSIGCEPCTRAITPTSMERAGRWWWEEETQRECGLHPAFDRRRGDRRTAERHGAPATRGAIANVTMVKKILANGEPCAKCGDVMERLERQEPPPRIDRVVEYREADADSEGAAIAMRLGVNRFPFFVVEDDQGNEEVIVTFGAFLRRVKGA